MSAITQATRPAVAPLAPTKRRRESITPYVFISPFYIGFIIFQLLPILFSLYLSLASWNGGAAIKFVGLGNFQTLIADPKFWNAFRVTLTITVVCTIAGTIGALALAVFLERVVDWLASLLRVIFFLPSVMLGTFQPAATRVAVQRSALVGTTIGSVSAWNAAGSIAGTLAAGFWLIPAFGIRSLTMIVAVMLALAGVTLGPWRRLQVPWAAIAVTLRRPAGATLFLEGDLAAGLFVVYAGRANGLSASRCHGR